MKGEALSFGLDSPVLVVSSHDATRHAVRVHPPPPPLLTHPPRPSFLIEGPSELADDQGDADQRWATLTHGHTDGVCRTCAQRSRIGIFGTISYAALPPGLPHQTICLLPRTPDYVR